MVAIAAGCPCDPSKPYADCCEPFHRGLIEPGDAATLMRSRYSAFVLEEYAHLHRTLHRDHDDAGSPDALRSRLQRHGKRARYRALTILDQDGPDSDGVARVLFHVEMKLEGKDASFIELSSFVHDGVGWRYLCGESRPPRGEWRKFSIASFR